MIILSAIFLFVPWIFGAPFEPTSKKEIKYILEFASAKKGAKIAELGSGDGRIVIALAKKGAEVHGYEINPFLVLYSKFKIRREKLQKKAFIHWKSFWKANLGRFDTIVLFQIGYVMNRLKKKLDKESKKGTKIISHYWKFPEWKYIKKKGKIYFYKK